MMQRMYGTVCRINRTAFGPIFAAYHVIKVKEGMADVWIAEHSKHSIFTKAEPLGWGNPENKFTLRANDPTVLEVAHGRKGQIESAQRLLEVRV